MLLGLLFFGPFLCLSNEAFSLLSSTFRCICRLSLFRARLPALLSHVLLGAVSRAFMPRQFYFPLTFHPRIRGAFVCCRSCLCLRVTLFQTYFVWHAALQPWHWRDVNFKINTAEETTIVIFINMKGNCLFQNVWSHTEKPCNLIWAPNLWW